MNKECSHHWVLEGPNGPMAKGVCKKCGMEGEFPNAHQPRVKWRIVHNTPSPIEDIYIGKCKPFRD